MNFFKKIRHRLIYEKVLLDTGPLFIYLIGKFQKGLLSERDQIFFNNLERFLNKKQKHITPQVLAEFNSLIKTRFKNYREDILVHSSDFIKKSFEIYIHKDPIFDNQNLGWLGVTDISLVEASQKGLILITGDRDLYSYCNSILTKNKPLHLEEFNSEVI